MSGAPHPASYHARCSGRCCSGCWRRDSCGCRPGPTESRPGRSGRTNKIARLAEQLSQTMLKELQELTAQVADDSPEQQELQKLVDELSRRIEKLQTSRGRPGGRTRSIVGDAGCAGGADSASQTGDPPARSAATGKGPGNIRRFAVARPGSAKPTVSSGVRPVGSGSASADLAAGGTDAGRATAAVGEANADRGPAGARHGHSATWPRHSETRTSPRWPTPRISWPRSPSSWPCACRWRANYPVRRIACPKPKPSASAAARTPADPSSRARPGGGALPATRWSEIRRRWRASDERQQVSGMIGEGPSRRDLIRSDEGQTEQAVRAYRDVYPEFRRQAEDVLLHEPLPLGHRQLIRQYFEAIRPSSDGRQERKPLYKQRRCGPVIPVLRPVAGSDRSPDPVVFPPVEPSATRLRPDPFLAFGLTAGAQAPGPGRRRSARRCRQTRVRSTGRLDCPGVAEIAS